MNRDAKGIQSESEHDHANPIRSDGKISNPIQTDSKQYGNFPKTFCAPSAACAPSDASDGTHAPNVAKYPFILAECL